ncbi:MAG: hypothetical protein LBF86_02025 [Helicobacteraceae bacterium]|nr:hypothetical protein [Helicobacteraceae bacterium]
MANNRPRHYNKRNAPRERLPSWRLSAELIESVKTRADYAGVSCSCYLEALIVKAFAPRVYRKKPPDRTPSLFETIV